MADNNTSKVILEAVRILVWPILAVSAVLWLGPDLRDVLKNRTWKIGIVEVGDRITGLNESMQTSLIIQKDYLSKIKQNAANPEKVKELSDSAVQDIMNAQKGVTQEIQNIREVIPQKTTAAPESPINSTTKTSEKINPSNAREWEQVGFGKLIERDVKAAITAFSEAEKSWPNYHNVAEIRQLLVTGERDLSSAASPKWRELYQHILKDLSWGMPTETRQKMQSYSGQR